MKKLSPVYILAITVFVITTAILGKLFLAPHFLAKSPNLEPTTSPSIKANTCYLLPITEARELLQLNANESLGIGDYIGTPNSCGYTSSTGPEDLDYEGLSFSLFTYNSKEEAKKVFNTDLKEYKEETLDKSFSKVDAAYTAELRPNSVTILKGKFIVRIGAHSPYYKNNPKDLLIKITEKMAPRL